MRKKLQEIDQVLLSRILFGTSLALVVLFAGTTVYFYQKYKQAAKVRQPLTQQQVKNAKTLLGAVDDLMTRPTVIILLVLGRYNTPNFLFG